MAGSGSRIVVATMKDEGPFILEWLAYHKVIGFDHFYVFSNDCWDTTPEILTTMAEALGIVLHYDNSMVNDLSHSESHDPQRRAYLKALGLRRVREAEFILTSDADEFLNIHVGDGTLSDLLASVPPFEAMSFTWRLFGSSGAVEIADALVLDQFTQCRPNLKPAFVRKFGVKTLFRPQRVEKIGVHRPFHVKPIQEGRFPIRWLNGSGEDHYEYYRCLKWHASDETHGCALAEMNHYALKSSEAFLAKMRRGSANSADLGRLGLAYRDFYNHNEERNTSIQRHIPAVKAQIEEWYSICPDLKRLHQEAVSLHKKIAREMVDLLGSEDPRYLSELGLTA